MPETALNGKTLNFPKATQWALTSKQIPEIPIGSQMEHEFSGARKHLKRPESYLLKAIFDTSFRLSRPSFSNWN